MKKILIALSLSFVFTIQAFAIPDKLVPIGQTTGIKILCDGVMVSSVTQIQTENGVKTPAKEASINTGDIIKTINGEKIISNDHVAEILNLTQNNEVLIEIERDGVILEKKVTPVADINDGNYKIGVWVRDSMAGIGTITFFDPETNNYGALGHSIAEGESGNVMPVRQGELVPSTVTGVKKGEVGNPGELEGSFDVTREIGSVNSNTESGIFGTIDANYLLTNNALEVAEKKEITEGVAYIMSNISGNNTENYEINITKINKSSDTTKNFVIEITDENLIEQTGGIVQGMSGSPIIQNGKIIGAVTHVFVNDPTKGYGIFITNMLETAELNTDK